MRQNWMVFAGAVAALLVSPLVMGAGPTAWPNGQPVIPGDRSNSTAVSSPDWNCIGHADFSQPLANGWFTQPNAIAANSSAVPPDSAQVMNNPPQAFAGLNPQPSCGPLEWALHSFLWLTSPTGRDSGNGIPELIFESPMFFDLLADGATRFNLVQNQPGSPPKLKVRAQKPLSGVVAEAQTTLGVLMAQPPKGKTVGSLVYYEMSVNDVYAYLVTGLAAKAPGIKNAFPTSQTELKPIVDFASKTRRSFQKEAGHSDEGVFALELKTAWVEADLVPTGCEYINRMAVIPTYDTTNPKRWVVNGQKTTKLALVGMHIVGSGGGHPEMIWSTFEHVCNTPNAAYVAQMSSATSEAFDNKTIDRATNGNWLFVANGSKGPFNVERISQAQGSTDLTAVAKESIGPSDTLRLFPWGSTGDAGNALKDSEILLLNHNVPLPAKDLRRWYVLVGAVWTTDGSAPSASNITGTTQLSNSTMETYIQTLPDASGKPSNKPGNCFTCHGAPGGRAPGTAMSHIFKYINSLDAATGPGTGVAAPAPGDTQSQAGSQAETSAAPTPALIGSQTNAAGQLTCTYQVAGTNQAAATTFTRATKRATCPATAAVPANLAGPSAAALASTTSKAPTNAVAAAAGGSSAAAVTLVGSEPRTGGGLNCTYSTGSGTFVRSTKRTACPQTAALPANAAAVVAGTAAAGSAAKTPTAGQGSPPPKVAKPPAATAVTIATPKLANRAVRCPYTATITGEITTAGPTTVEYTWISSDGRSWPTQSLAFASATRQSVSTQWAVGSRGSSTVNEWIELSVVSPNRKVSRQLPIKLKCGS